jgi:hypothetical protein
MHRRSLLTALASLGLVGIARTARADLAVGPPPPRLAVRPEPNTFQGTPASVTLHVQNPTADAVDIQGIRLLITDAGIRFPLHITHLEVDGRASGVYDRITLAGNATRRLVIGFDQVPPTALRSRSLAFLIRFGGAAESTFTLRRA